jgi:hypothetical protein
MDATKSNGNLSKNPAKVQAGWYFLAIKIEVSGSV